MFKHPAETVNRPRRAAFVMLESPLPGAFEFSAKAYRVRVGDYRIVYEVHERVLTVVVMNVGHRREVYRRT